MSLVACWLILASSLCREACPSVPTKGYQVHVSSRRRALTSATTQIVGADINGDCTSRRSRLWSYTVSRRPVRSCPRALPVQTIRPTKAAAGAAVAKLIELEVSGPDHPYRPLAKVHVYRGRRLNAKKCLGVGRWKGKRTFCPVSRSVCNVSTGHTRRNEYVP